MTDKKGTEILAKLHETSKPTTLEGWLKKMRPELAKALPKHVNPDRILRIAVTAIRVAPKLRTCEPMSFLAAIMQSAQLGLEPNTPLGEAYLIPYNSKTGLKCQFQIGYRGIITLAQNTGQYRSIYAHPVYKNDKFSFQLGLHKDLVHIPADEPEGEPIYYYAVYHLLNGGFDFSVWSRKKVELHRDKYSKSAKFTDSSWQTDFIAMALKTVVKSVLNYAPKSIELAKQLAMDETIKTGIAPDMSEVPQEEFDITPPKPKINPKTGEIKEVEKPGSSYSNAKSFKELAKEEAKDFISDEDIPNC
ncbi:recombinase RecT [Candidatus Atribacteria bacterium HGW-Atribacteria-1]|nr:MAG: recombinase RecT [Candidatus Atribacteria bacterium HGW-Atribacteria-1]